MIEFLEENGSKGRNSFSGAMLFFTQSEESAATCHSGGTIPYSKSCLLYTSSLINKHGRTRARTLAHTVN